MPYPFSSKIHITLPAVLAAAFLGLTAAAQTSAGVSVMPAAQLLASGNPAPRLNLSAFRLNDSEVDRKNGNVDEDSSAAPDTPDTTSQSHPHEGRLKRAIERIGADQRRLYLAPFEAHNIKWDALVLAGTGTLLVFDRRIEKHISTDHFHAYQNTSNIAIYGLAASLGGIYLFGLNPEHTHARETGALELETLVNTFLIYTPMQLIFARQRPGEGNGNGDFFKHHAINTSFPGGHAMFTFAMASVLADEYPKPWARALAYGAATTVTVTRFLARDHFASDMFIGAALGTAIAENTFHARCNSDLPSQCKHHSRWWKPMKIETK